jgi:ribose-phosphate pyrophosphokinase
MLLLNDKPVPYFTFSGGEIQVKLPTNLGFEKVILTWKPKNAVDFLLLPLTVNALNEMGIENIHVEILYLPYARQDRACTPGEAFSLRMTMDVLTQLHVTSITVWDTHSDVAVKYMGIGHYWSVMTIKNIFKNHNMLGYFDRDNLILCSPDKGSGNKVQSIADEYPDLLAMFCEKRRNPDTGFISEIIVPELHNSTEDILVIDDICDGGATFIALAKQLKKQTTGKLYLYVTHGIFSKGINELLEDYEHIYCHHVLHDNKYQSDSNLTILQEFTHDH